MMIKEIPFSHGTLKGVYDCGDGCEMQIWAGAGKDAFGAYSRAVGERGFVPANERSIGGNSYATYTKGGELIHFYYIAAADELRVVSGKNDVIPALFDGADRGGTVPCACTMMPMSYTVASGGGQCVIFTLADGTFFVMDRMLWVPVPVYDRYTVN